MIRTKHCWCGDWLLADKTCPNRCSRWAEPGHLRAQKRKRQARDAHAKHEEQFKITVEDIRRMRSAMRKMDPIYAAQSKRYRKSATTRYGVGGAK